MTFNILVAEDNEFTAKQYKTALEKKGHQVTLTKDGEECFDVYNDEVKYSELFKKSKQSPFDIVLLDQRIIFLSAYAQKILVGADNVKEDTIQILQKPFSLDFLVKKIEGRILNSRANRTLEDRIKGDQVNNLMTITQDKEAIR